jgi:cyclase
LQPTVIIPGHGPIMHDDAYLRMEVDLFASIKRQVEAVVARGANLEETSKSVNLDDFRKLFAGESKVKNALFSVYVVGPAVASAFHDATEKR